MICDSTAGPKTCANSANNLPVPSMPGSRTTAGNDAVSVMTEADLRDVASRRPDETAAAPSGNSVRLRGTGGCADLARRRAHGLRAPVVAAAAAQWRRGARPRRTLRRFARLLRE